MIASLSNPALTRPYHSEKVLCNSLRIPAKAQSERVTPVCFVTALSIGCCTASRLIISRSYCRRTRLQAKDGWPKKFVVSSDVGEAVAKVSWPDEWPYTPEDFAREDERNDAIFYNEPRLVTHVDDQFISTLTEYYRTVFKEYPKARILDICSSWVSHYPMEKDLWSHVSITGMNKAELSRNVQADDFRVNDLNLNPVLDYPSKSFDIVTCAVSLVYLNKPLEVMREVARVLKPGGSVILSTSNRHYPPKAINLWLSTDDPGHALIYSSYLHYTGAFEDIEAKDLSSIWSKMNLADPVLVIRGKKRQ